MNDLLQWALLALLTLSTLVNAALLWRISLDYAGHGRRLAWLDHHVFHVLSPGSEAADAERESLR